MLLSDLIQKFLAWCEKMRKPRTAEYYRTPLQKFLGHAGDVPIDTLKRADLGYAKTWHEIQPVQRLFQFALTELEAVAINPFSKVRRPPKGERSRILSRREQATYLRASGKAFRQFWIAMRGTMARPQEVRALTWPMLEAPPDWRGNIDEALAAGCAMFVIRQGFKSQERMFDPRKPRIILIDRRVSRLLLRLRAKAKSLAGHVFLNRRGKPWTANALRCSAFRLRVKFKAPRVNGENIVCYSMRHTAATFASPKVSQKVLAELMGHRSVKTTERYQHLEVDQLRDALVKIEDVEGKKAEREGRNPKTKRDRETDFGPSYDALHAKMNEIMKALQQNRQPTPSIEAPKHSPAVPMGEPRTRRAPDIVPYLKAIRPPNSIPISEAETVFGLDKLTIKRAIVEGRIEASWGHQPPRRRKCLFVSAGQCLAERNRIDANNGKPPCSFCGTRRGRHTPACGRTRPQSGPSF